jgi:hypothetical protein
MDPKGMNAHAYVPRVLLQVESVTYFQLSRLFSWIAQASVFTIAAPTIRR